MRGHGVPKFPDPKITTGPGGGQAVDLRGAGLDFQAPAFQAAAKACGGGPRDRDPVEPTQIASSRPISASSASGSGYE